MPNTLLQIDDPPGRDALFVCLLNVFTIFLVGLIVFSTLGHLSLERSLDVTEVIVNGELLF